MTEYDEDEMSVCDRCGDVVPTETIFKLGDGICENCWDDL